MKVAHVISTFPPYKGGMGNSVYHAAIQIGWRGHESVVFTPAYSGLKSGEEIIGKNTKLVRLRPFFSIGNAAVLPQLLWKLRHFDIVHLHYPFFGTADIIVLARIFFKGKLVLHYHMDTVAKGLKGMIFKMYEFFFLPIIIRMSAVITCASLDYIRQSALSAYYLNHESSFMEIPFGVDAQHFTPGETQRSPIILFVGGLDTAHNFKGVKELIIAFSRIHSKCPEARLVLVGKGDLEGSYMDLAKEKGAADKVIIDNAASDEDLARWYKKACVLVLPSVNKSEAFGLVLLEAMSSATPVIASNLPGVRNVFHNRQHGFLLKPGDIDALAEKLEFIVRNQEEARKMGEAARRWIEERYSWDKVGERLEAAYLRIAFALIKHHENLPRS